MYGYMYVKYMHTDIHAYIHTCIQTYIHTYMHAYIHTCMHTYIHTYIRIRSYTHAYTNAQIHTYIGGRQLDAFPIYEPVQYAAAWILSGWKSAQRTERIGVCACMHMQALCMSLHVCMYVRTQLTGQKALCACVYLYSVCMCVCVCRL